MLHSKDDAIKTALKGNWEEAIKINKQLLKENPEDTETLNRLALAFSIIGRAPKAKSTYQKVLELDPLNSIALKGLKKLKTPSSRKNGDSQNLLVNNIFLEETGKTKVVDLINIAQSQVISGLKTGQSLTLQVKRSKIFVTQDERQYIGVLPDDIGKRLIKFIGGGNKYEAYVRSSTSNSVTVFLKEVKKSGRFKGQLSFVSTEKKLPIKKLKAKDRNDGDEEETVYEEE
ncbi:MAG: hypothetical protein AAB801_02770 [Patescibacteria group bacterium]